MGVQIDNLFPGLMTGRPGVNHPGVIKSRVSSPKAMENCLPYWYSRFPFVIVAMP